MAHDPLRLEEQLCFALYSASRAMTRAYAPLLEPLGITYPQYLALLVLWERDAVSVRELGEKLGLDSGTLTPLLKRLEQQGLVRRTRDEADERVLRLTLTAEGRALRSKARGVPTAIARCAGIDARDPQALAELRDLRDRLHALTTELETQ